MNGSDVDCCSETVQRIVHGAVGLAKVALRLDLAAPEVIRDRRDACRLCPHSTKRERNGITLVSRCLKCQCLIGPKSRLASEECPVGRWR